MQNCQPWLKIAQTVYFIPMIMLKEFKLKDIRSDGFLHSRVYELYYEPEKLFKVNFGFADLIQGGAIVDCTISITDWWDFEVLHYKDDQFINRFSGKNIPELDSIVSFIYDGNNLILEDLCGIEEYYKFIFTKPKIHITGEYDPD